MFTITYLLSIALVLCILLIGSFCQDSYTSSKSDDNSTITNERSASDE
jgi:hypothetical protein